MAKGRIITDRIRGLILEVHQKHPKWKAKEVRNEVNYLLKVNDPQLPRDWPSLSAVQKILAQKNKFYDSRDNPWSIGSLVEYPIPPEALPVVMGSYMKLLAENKALTIREALWIARLHKIIDVPELVWWWAHIYALSDMSCCIQGKPFDSKDLDTFAITPVLRSRESKRGIAIWGIAKKYKAICYELPPLFNRLMDLNLPIEETEEFAKSISKEVHNLFFKEVQQDEGTHQAKGQP